MSPALRPQIGVLRALGLGDLLTAVPALRALARAFPRHERLLLAPRPLQPLLPLIVERGRPCVDRLHEVSGLAASPASLPQDLDLAVNLHGRGPESHRLLLGAAPRRLIAFRNEAVEGTAAMPPWDEEEHEAARWCRLLASEGIEADPEQLEIETPRLDLPDWVRGATLLHPGAAGAARRWPPERWAAVAAAEQAAGRTVVITGSRAEVGLGRRIAAAAGIDPARQLAGRTDLRSLAALVAVAGRVVCGDTGVAHLATALATPSLLLFGPTSPARWGPPPGRSIHRVIWRGREGDPHGAAVDGGLLEIEAEQVIAELAGDRSLAVR